MKVSVIGGTGFVGSYLVDELLARGHTPRLMVRPGSEGKVRSASQCEVVRGEVSERAALAECMSGGDAMIFLIGILREFPARGITFEGAQYQAFADSLEAARAAGIRRVVLMSANGAEHAAVAYQKTKRRAEQLLESSDTDWTIFRPSVIFGDPRGRMEFCTQLKAQLVDPPLPAAVFFPGLNVFAAGEQAMSPVYVGNVAEAFAACLDDPESYRRTLTLGGPRTLSWKEIIRTIARATGKKHKLTMPAPAWGVKTVAHVMQGFAWFPLTADQVTMLMQGNEANGSDAFQLFGIDAIAFDERELDYLTDH